MTDDASHIVDSIKPMTSEAVRQWEANLYEFLETPVPDSVLNAGCRVVMDVLAASVAGSTSSPQRAAIDAPLPEGESSVLGTTAQRHPTSSALLNTAAVMTAEIEEGHNKGGHVGASVVAGAIGAAEAADCTGRDFLEACIKSYELCVRLEYAIFAMKNQINDAIPWLLRDPHSTWTTVGPALTAAQCLGADSDGIRETFRTAANLAVVSMHDPYAEGAESRNFTAGYSAQAGVSAAYVAMAGIRGSATAIATVYDPFQLLLDTGEFDQLFAELGSVWEIERAYFKHTPSCRYTHPPLDALEELDPKTIDPLSIESIVVHTYANGADMAHSSPQTMTSAKFSIPYVLARRLVAGPLGLADFEPAAISDSQSQALADRVTVQQSTTFDEVFPDRWGARVEVTLDSGKTLSASREWPAGDYRDPMAESDLDSLCERLFSTALSPNRAAEAVETCRRLPDVTVRDVTAALTPN